MVQCPEWILVYIRYSDHVVFSRSSACVMNPLLREAIGWLVYECETYVTIVWDRDAGRPTLKGGDPKASGIVLLKTDIQKLTKLKVCNLPSKENSEWHLSSTKPTQRDEYALQSKKRKTQGKQKREMATT